MECWSLREQWRSSSGGKTWWRPWEESIQFTWAWLRDWVSLPFLFWLQSFINVFNPIGCILILATITISGGEGHACFCRGSPFCFDGIIFTTFPPWETCQSHPAQINHPLSCLSCAAHWFSSQLRGTVVRCYVGSLLKGNRWSKGDSGQGFRLELTEISLLWHWPGAQRGHWNKKLWAGVKLHAPI